jgi:hypothetical protein
MSAWSKVKPNWLPEDPAEAGRVLAEAKDRAEAAGNHEIARQASLWLSSLAICQRDLYNSESSDGRPLVKH